MGPRGRRASPSDKDVPGARNVALNGDFFTKVYEGPKCAKKYGQNHVVIVGRTD